ncbi:MULTISPECIES: hypothetical protein [unclassified Bradyrhizobium]
MRRREFIGAIAAVSTLPVAVWSQAVWSQQASYDGSNSSPAGTIPLSYDDARFSGNVVSNAVTIAAGETLSNKSITQNGGIASILMPGGGTIQTCRVNSRECVRIGGSGSFVIDNCYLEALGSGADHADVIQAYSPGSRGTLRVSNTAIVTHNVAANVGLFIADNWTGTIDLENVVFIGGGVNFGLRVHPDVGGDNIIKLKNVFFVPPFKYGLYFIGDYGGRKNIVQVWDNVRKATIVDGTLVPGSVVAKPA